MPRITICCGDWTQGDTPFSPIPEDRNWEIAGRFSGRVVAQGMTEGYLLRVFVDVNRTPAEVVTVYRTSKLRKYGS